MRSGNHTERIAEICAELLEIIDASRASSEDDANELVNCIVHDCVQTMRRALADNCPATPVEVELRSLRLDGDQRRRFN